MTSAVIHLFDEEAHWEIAPAAVEPVARSLFSDGKSVVQASAAADLDSDPLLFLLQTQVAKADTQDGDGTQAKGTDGKPADGKPAAKPAAPSDKSTGKQAEKVPESASLSRQLQQHGARHAAQAKDPLDRLTA